MSKNKSETSSESYDNSIVVPVSKRARGWIFTINNYTDKDIKQCDSLGETIKDKEYMIYAFEVGKKGTPHIQGYVHFKNQKSRGTMSKALPRASFRVAVADDLKNQKYCSKDGEFYEFGKPIGQGKRTDLEKIVNKVRNENIRDINSLIDINPALVTRNLKNIASVIRLSLKVRDSPPRVTWIYGPTGVGKTRYVYDSHGIENVYAKSITKWWDERYIQQEAILIDDFCGKWPFRDLLRLLDRYPYEGQTKGGHVQINSPYIYITCDRTPKALYNKVLSDYEYRQFIRRITEIIYISSPGVYEEGIDGSDIVPEMGTLEHMDIDKLW